MDTPKPPDRRACVMRATLVSTEARRDTHPGHVQGASHPGHRRTAMQEPSERIGSAPADTGVEPDLGDARPTFDSGEEAIPRRHPRDAKRIDHECAGDFQNR